MPPVYCDKIDYSEWMRNNAKNRLERDRNYLRTVAITVTSFLTYRLNFPILHSNDKCLKKYIYNNKFVKIVQINLRLKS